MVRAVLVDLDIQLGARILEHLDAAGFTVPVALWVKWGEEERWRLLLASPLYERLGATKAYRNLLDSLWSDYDWVSSPIHLESTRSPFVRALRRTFGKADNVCGKRLGGQTIGDTWVDEAYLYRIR